MKIAAVIAEYNPFHTGHAYQLAQIRKELQVDYIVVLMSGDYAQRGIPAVFDKYVRTHMALSCGADLVLELPIYYALGSAEYFAKGAISILNALHIIDYLHFGSECGDILFLQDIAKLLVKEPPAYKQRLQDALKKGVPYPSARMQACIDCLANMTYSSETLAQSLASPNNILGIEYCKALLSSKSTIKPITLKRSGSEYNDTHLPSKKIFPSASALRAHIFDCTSNFDIIYKYIPDAANAVLNAFKPVPISMDDFSAILHYSLLYQSKEDYTQYLDVTPELADRIHKCLPAYIDFSSFCQTLKTKNYTYTRISRCLFHILLNIQTSYLEALTTLKDPPYVRMLGFRKESAALLSYIKQNSTLPFISRLAGAQTQLSDASYRFLQTDLFATAIYRSVLTAKTGIAQPSELCEKMICFS